MTTNSDRASAKIFQFPARGRFAASGHREETTAPLTSPVVKAAVGSGWYHEEAILDAERARKN
jgi:hypothetical protein